MHLWDHHLGELAAALVDGELDHPTRERALTHLARCAACREEVEHQRWLKGRLRTMTDGDATDELVERLLQLPGLSGRGGRLVARHGRFARTRSGTGRRLAARASSPLPRGGPGRPRRSPRGSTRRRRLGYAIAGSTSALLATVGVTAYAVGGPATAPQVTPVMQQLVDEHVATTTEMPFSDSGNGVAVTVSAGRTGSR